MDSEQSRQLEVFLQQVRAGALKYAACRCRDEDAALDVLQDAMIGFVDSAADFPQQAWKSLFYKILQRRISDRYRKHQWRNRLAQMFSLSSHNDEGEADYEPAQPEHGEHHYETAELQQAFDEAVQALPERQQQAYLLRQWQQLSVKQVADIMQCSEGSVKTHLSRAMASLKLALGEWIDEEN